METTALAAESTVAQMARLVEQAAAAQSPTETLVQRFARVYTPLVLLATACVAFVPFAAGRPDHKVRRAPVHMRVRMSTPKPCANRDSPRGSRGKAASGLCSMAEACSHYGHKPQSARGVGRSHLSSLQHLRA